MKSFLLFTEAWLWLALARMMLLLLPFRKLTPLLGKKTAPSLPEQLPAYHKKLRKIGKAIRRAGKYSPWRTQCFEQALAAKLMLKCRGMASTVFFGVSRSLRQEEMHAHAWLESCGMYVTGGKHLEQFTVIACFKS